MVSYESQLHTNSDKPVEFQKDYRDVIYLNDDGYYQADVYFKEQNTINFTIGKVKSNDALYWSAGIGYLEINSEDADRGVFLSSLTQQKDFHRKINEIKGATLREYNYITQPEENQSGLLLKATLGKDYSIYTKNSHRSYIRNEISTRLTSINGASYITGSVEIGHEYRADSLSFLPHLKVSAKYDYQRFSDSSIYKGVTFEISAQSKYFATKLKYVIPDSEYANYLNPLPQDFTNRELSYPAIEPTVMFTIEGKIPN